ncbi:VasL domain-containing protein [Providencia rettgeri]|uniref:VasL domain-containing protein n=1 Tax=Providencia rettgeri TaxID=587 RepID=UPI0034E0734C
MNSDLTTINVGGDPRTLSDFSALKDELNKRFHPARPDIDWARAHGLCLSLFSQNGADLQTASWFTLIRQHQIGMAGLSEGLVLLQRLLAQHWQTLWPLQTHARVEILSVLSQQLITGLRGNSPVYTDLPALYQAEAALSKIEQQLQTLELKHLTQLDRLHDLLTNQARNLESTDAPESGFMPSTPLHIPKTAPSTFHARTAAAPIAIKANATLSPKVEPTGKSKPLSFRRGVGIGFLAGILITGISSSAIFYSFSPWDGSHEMTKIFPHYAEFTPEIATLLDQQLQPSSAQSTEVSNEKLSVLDNYLVELGALSPIWAQQYGLNMVNYLADQYSGQANVSSFNDKWQQTIQTNALSQNQLNQWAQGMDQLNKLSVRLDSLDGKPRSYITGSELKTIIFNARQYFNQGIPLEEELRRLEALQAQGTVAESEYQRIDNHFKQLLNRYALLRHPQEGQTK